MGSASRIRSGFLTLTIKDKNILYAAYMSFLNNLGEDVSLLLSLMDETEKLPVQATVVWVTPKGAQGNRAPGVGVQFKGEEGKQVRNKIETYLTGMIKSDKSTYTL